MNTPSHSSPLTLVAFQQLIRDRYYATDSKRGVPATFLLLTEEFGELATALHANLPGKSPSPEQRANLEEEFADVLAWLATIANVAGIDLDAAVRKKYGSGCPGCGQFLCQCDISEKP